MENDRFIDTLLTRRSIRRYLEKKIPGDTIMSILKTGMYAPSAVNKQPWHFLVIDDLSIFKKITAIHRYASFITGASQAILVLGDEHLHHDTDYWHVDCAASTQNMLLAAHSLGIGSCWIGIYPRKKRISDFSALFDLPSHIKPFALVALGYPDEERPVPDRFREERIHYNHW